jgi:hypothetical protein
LTSLPVVPYNKQVIQFQEEIKLLLLPDSALISLNFSLHARRTVLLARIIYVSQHRVVLKAIGFSSQIRRRPWVFTPVIAPFAPLLSRKLHELLAGPVRTVVLFIAASPESCRGL